MVTHKNTTLTETSFAYKRGVQPCVSDTSKSRALKHLRKLLIPACTCMANYSGSTLKVGPLDLDSNSVLILLLGLDVRQCLLMEASLQMCLALRQAMAQPRMLCQDLCPCPNELCAQRC